MSLTLGLTGMDPATETALRAAFADANARVGGRWNLVPEFDAEHVMVDMDSMYGPMSWLRLHASGKRVIGLTTAPRTQTDFRLGRPFDGEAFAALLRDVERDLGVAQAAPAAAVATPSSAAASAIAATRAGSAERSEAVPLTPGTSAPPAAATSDDASSHDRETVSPDRMPAAASPTAPQPSPATPAPVALTPAVPSGSTPAPAPQDLLPEEVVHAAAAHDADPETLDPAPPAAPAAPALQNLAAWLAPGALAQRVRYRRSAGPTLLIDPLARTYQGPSTLKPFTAYFRDDVAEADFEPLDDAAWARDSAAAGNTQPLLRLQWLGGMVHGRAALADDHAAGTRFQLTKWPQTEREFPKHFRIATAMMKGPATLAEIADASTMPIDEVFEFVNANLVTGFAERIVDAPPEADPEPSRPGGLLGRFRAR